MTIRITNITKMLFVGSAKEAEAYASFNFQPNNFDSKFVSGATALTVSLHLPPGLKADRTALYQTHQLAG